jgi:hypothetical protein
MTATRHQVEAENRDKAARYLFRANSPIGEPVDQWENTDEYRKNVYRRSADAVAKLYMGWDRV